MFLGFLRLHAVRTTGIASRPTVSGNTLLCFMGNLWIHSKDIDTIHHLVNLTSHYFSADTFVDS